jgi:GAF domain-containing protein
MERQPFPPWLERLAERPRVVTAAVGILCAALGVWLWASPSALTHLIGLAGVVAATAIITWLTYQLLGAAARAKQLAELSAELTRANATLTESLAALRASRQDLARQKMLAENLLTVARATGQRPVLEVTLQNTLAICVALTGATDGSLFLLDANGRVTQHLFARQDVAPQQVRALVGQAMSDGLAGWAARNRQAARVTDTLTDPRWAAASRESVLIRSALAVPLISRDLIVGVLTLMHPSARHFTEEHERLLSDAADQVALALDNARMFDTMTRLTDRLSLLYEVSQTTAQPDLDLALDQALRAVRAATGWPTVSAFLFDEHQTLAARAAVGAWAQEVLEHRRPSGDGIIAQAASTAQVQRAGDTMSEIAAPVCIGGRVLGVLDAVSAEPDTFTSEDLELLSAVADTLALAIAYAELSQRQSG